MTGATYFFAVLGYSDDRVRAESLNVAVLVVDARGREWELALVHSPKRIARVFQGFGERTLKNVAINIQSRVEGFLAEFADAGFSEAVGKVFPDDGSGIRAVTFGSIVAESASAAADICRERYLPEAVEAESQVFELVIKLESQWSRSADVPIPDFRSSASNDDHSPARASWNLCDGRRDSDRELRLRNVVEA